jgi:hypothetical protein
VPRKRTELDKAVERTARIIQDQLDTLPPEVAKRKVRELRQMAAKVYRAAKSGQHGLSACVPFSPGFQPASADSLAPF